MSGVVPFYIKTAYQDEPSFANTKVVTSLFAKNIKNDFGPDFKQCVEFRDATSELLTKYKDQFDFEEICKLAIDYSDGIVLAEKGISRSLTNYAKKKDIPVLGLQDDNFGDAYDAFYDSICPDPE